MADPATGRPHDDPENLRHAMPNTGSEKIPPGATREALDRPRTPPAAGPNDDAETERTIDDVNNQKGEGAGT